MENFYYYDEKNSSLIIKFYVQPSAKKTEIISIFNNAIKCKLNAPPVDGKANSELIKFLKKLLKTSSINIISGLTSREKKVAIKLDNNNNNQSNQSNQINNIINILFPQTNLPV